MSGRIQPRWRRAGTGLLLVAVAALPAAGSAGAAPVQLPNAAAGAWPGGPAGAAAHLRAGRYQEAETGYRAAIEESGARLGLAETLRLTGRYREALGVLTPREEGASGTRELLTRARLHLEIGEGPAAAELLEELLAGGARPSSRLEAEAALGLLELRQGKRESGLDHLDAVIDAYNRAAPTAFRARELAAVGEAAAALGFQSPGLFRDALRVFDEAAARDPGDPRPRLLAAELLLEKFNTAEASESITAVLRHNPKHPRALLLMARVQDRGGGVSGGEPGRPDALAEALAVNPLLPAARALEVERLLERERIDEARDRAAGAAGDLPESPEILAALAAVHFLSGEDASLAALEARFRERWRGDPLLELELASAAERRRLYQEAARRSRAALRIRPDSAAAGRLLGLNLLRLGKMAEGRDILEETFSRDPFDALVKNTLDLLDELDGFRTVSRPPFEFVLPDSEAELLLPYVEEISREALETFRSRYGFEPEGTLRIEMYDRSADFSVRTVGIPGIGAHGVCFGNVIAMESPSAREIGSYHWASTLWHELAHVVSMGLTGNRVPRWFTEGLSLLEERRRFGDGVGLPFFAALRDDRLLDVSHLNDGFVRPTWPGQVAVSYFHASFVLEHIEREFGFPSVLEMLDGYRGGLGSDDVIQKTLGISPAVLDTAVDEVLDARFGAAARGLAKADHGAARILGAVPPGEDGGLDALLAAAAASPDNFVLQLQAGMALYEAGRDEEAFSHFEMAAEIAPEYGGADGPHRYLSLLHERRGRAEETRLALTRHLSRVPAAYDDWLRLAEMNAATEAPDAAGAALVSAIEAYPMYPEPHERLADTAAALGQTDLELRERRAVLASGAPDRAEALYALARAHLRAGNRDASRRRVLEALEIAPTFHPALRLLLDLRSESR